MKMNDEETAAMVVAYDAPTVGKADAALSYSRKTFERESGDHEIEVLKNGEGLVLAKYDGNLKKITFYHPQNWTEHDKAALRRWSEKDHGFS